MADPIKLISALLFLALITQRSLQQPCQNGDVEVSQKASGRTMYKHKTEFIASISNKCVCTLTNVEMNCKGFETAVAVDPKVLSKTGDTCKVNNGRPVGDDEPFTFSYFSDDPFPFQIRSYKFLCS